MALINASSLIWAFYLDGKLRQRPTPKTYEVHVEGTKLFEENDLEEVRQTAKAQMQKSIDGAAEQLQRSVAESAQEIAARINDSSSDTLKEELEKYSITLGELHAGAIRQFTELQQDIEKHRQEMLQRLETDLSAERERRINSFNERINQVVSSYLAEALGSRVDLGAQGPYILQMLQEHKEDIKRDILS